MNLTRDRIIELAEWVFWVVVVDALVALVEAGLTGRSALEAARSAAVSALVMAILTIGRWRLTVVPEPGAGIPAVKALQRPKPATHDELVELGRLPDDILNGLLDS